MTGGTARTTGPVTPLRLPRLSRNEAQARSMVAQRARELPIRLAQTDWSVTLVPLEAAQPAAAPDGWTLQAEWAGAAVAIVLPGQAASAWVRERFPDIDLARLPDAYGAAILEAVSSDLAAAVSALQRGPARLVAAARGGEARDLAHLFSLSLASASGERIAGQLATDSLGLMLVAGLLAQRPPQPNEIDADALPIVVRIELGHTALTGAQLRQLVPGDTVLLQHAYTRADGQLFLAAGAGGFAVRHDEGARLTVTRAWSPLELNMTTPAESTPPLAPDALPLRVTFDLGERSLTLGELRALQVGQTLELGRPLAQAVTLRVNGCALGSGELVDVDGRLGVTLTSLAPGAGAAP